MLLYLHTHLHINAHAYVANICISVHTHTHTHLQWLFSASPYAPWARRTSSSSLHECYLRHSCAMSHAKCTLGACAAGIRANEVLALPLMLKNFQHTDGVMLSGRWQRCNTCLHTRNSQISFPKFWTKFWKFPKCVNWTQFLVAKCDAHVSWSNQYAIIYAHVCMCMGKQRAERRKLVQ